MTIEEMRKLVRESDVIDKTDGSELARAFNYLWDKYVEAKMFDTLEHAHWINYHSGTITCSHCGTWFHKDERYSYMRHCPYCGEKITGVKESRYGK